MNLYDRLMENAAGDMYPMHMPGHKRNRLWNMCNPYSIDITEIDGFDNLHSPDGLIADIEERASKTYHSLHTCLLVNGSTAGILAGISAVCHKKDRILISRGSHISVYHAAEICELRTETITPEYNEYGIMKGLTAAQVRASFSQYDDISLVVLTSPTYEGMFSEVSEIAEIVHENSAILMVDEAHGAHLRFSGYISAIDCGADIVVHSLHKTLPAFTQTALLHICSSRISFNSVRHYLDIFQTSSPSYILMAGIERCIDYLGSHPEEDFRLYMKRLRRLYRNLKTLMHLKIIEHEDRDMGKIVIFTGKSSISGRELYNILIEKYHIQPEMASCESILCMTSVCDTEEGFNRLEKALLEIDISLEDMDKPVYRYASHLPDKVFEISETSMMLNERIPINESEGRISADYLYMFPPGIAVLLPGEKIDSELLCDVEKAEKKGIPVNRSEILCVRQDKLHISEP